MVGLKAAALAALCLLLLVPAARADTATFTAEADTYTSSWTPATNYGTATALRVDGTDDVRRSYLRFDVQLPDQAVINSATLRVYTGTTNTASGFNVSQVSSTSWDEMGVTHRDAPAFGGELASSGPWSTAGYRNVALPAGAVALGKNSFGLGTRSSSHKTFRSRETSVKPELVVDYSLQIIEPLPSPACSDGIDNDGDGKIDHPADAGCESTLDEDETDPAPPAAACADGEDNDADGQADHPADPGCTDPADDDETDPPPPPPPADEGNLAPESGALLGAWHKGGSGWTTAEYERFEAAIGRKLDINHHFVNWGGTWWPNANMGWDRSSGRHSMLSIGGTGDFPGFDAVNSGSQDAWIASRADAIKALGHKVLLRPWWEMNGDWGMPWQGVANGGSSGGPAKYVQAWKRMVDIFRARGATNALWVWAPNCDTHPNDAWNYFTNYYPGDDYVDWVGCDGYNFGTTESWSTWTQWSYTFGTSWDRRPSVYASYPHKPFMVAETASCEQGGDKGAWIDRARSEIKSSFPNVKAFVWFDENKECDWRAESSPASLAAFRELAADPYFGGSAEPPPDTTAPAPPSGLAATGGDGQVALEWAESPEDDLAGYRVYRQDADGSWPANPTATVEVDSTSYTDTGLTNGTEYRYRVTAVDGAGNESLPSPEAGGTPVAPPPPPDTQPPAAPTGLAVDARDGEVSLDWADSPEADLREYRVYRQNSDGSWPPNATATVGASAYTESGLANGREYRYRVTAVDGAGNESEPSAEAGGRPEAPPDTQAPGAPTELALEAGDGEVSLNWADNPESDLREYRVYRQGADGSWPPSPAATVTPSDYTDTGLTNGTEYHYRVTAVDNAGNESQPSAEVGGTPAPPPDTDPPAAPTGLTSTAGDGQVALDWTRNSEPDLNEFRVYRRAADGSWPADPIADPGSSDYLDTGLDNGTEYTYRVTAVDDAGNESAPSETTSATPKAPPPKACADGADNDDDGHVDHPADPGCTSEADDSEADPPPPGSSSVLAAAGDIATSGSGDEATARLVDAINPDHVLTLGDNAYPDGTLSQFLSYYEPTWGRHKAKTKPVPGNHEYHTGGTGYFEYFGPAAGEPGKGYYSYDVAGWHIVALNSAISRGVGSEQETWLRQDLAANAGECTLAYWHHPRWNIGTKGHNSSMAPLWNALYDAGADVVLVGHDHNYQRYYRLDKTGARDDAAGIRQFNVGSGGASHYGVTIRPPAEIVNQDTYGVLKLTIQPGSYDWEFVPEANKTFTDSGSETCH